MTIQQPEWMPGNYDWNCPTFLDELFCLSQSSAWKWSAFCAALNPSNHTALCMYREHGEALNAYVKEQSVKANPWGALPAELYDEEGCKLMTWELDQKELLAIQWLINEAIMCFAREARELVEAGEAA